MECFCKNLMVKTKIGKIEYYSCFNCNYLRKINLLSSTEERKRYDYHCCDDNYIIYMRDVYDKIKNHLNPGLSLDYGCGKIHCLSDILNEEGRVCKYYDLYYYPQKIEDAYDNIILIEVFEHVKDIYTLLVNLKAMLNSKGKIIIMTKPQPKDLNQWWYLRDETHISFVTEKTMKILADMLKMNLEFIEDSSLFIFNSIS